MNKPAPQYYLPAALSSLLTTELTRCRNLGLLLDKYIPTRAIASSKGKLAWLQQLQFAEHSDPILAQHAYQRWLRMTAALHATRFDATTAWRLAPGLGGHTVLESDLTLHALYGLPLIPGQALKGLTRAYATGEIERDTHLENTTDDHTIETLFGNQQSAGSVIFFDALPKDGRAHIFLDVMNPHYADYYQHGNTPPSNDHFPRPLPFITIKKTTFTFALAPRDPASEEHHHHTTWAVTWLRAALQRYGIGSKTNAGYGYFS